MNHYLLLENVIIYPSYILSTIQYKMDEVNEINSTVTYTNTTTQQNFLHLNLLPYAPVFYAQCII